MSKRSTGSTYFVRWVEFISVWVDARFNPHGCELAVATPTWSSTLHSWSGLLTGCNWCLSLFKAMTKFAFLSAEILDLPIPLFLAMTSSHESYEPRVSRSLTRLAAICGESPGTSATSFCVALFRQSAFAKARCARMYVCCPVRTSEYAIIKPISFPSPRCSRTLLIFNSV